MSEEEIREDERTKCWQAINRRIRQGDLGVELNERRNGLVVAANEIAVLGVKDGESARFAEE